VTQPLIDACHPNARQRKAAMEIQKVKPIPPKQLEKHMEAEKKRARSSDDSPKPRL